MKYVKAHLFLIICGAVIALALTVNFWLLAGYATDTQDNANTLAGNLDTINGLLTAKISPNPDSPIKDQRVLRGPVVPKFIEVKKQVVDNIKAQEKDVEQEVALMNRLGKVKVEMVDAKDKDGKAIKEKKYIPLLNNNSLRLNGSDLSNVLPAVNSTEEAWGFKYFYRQVFNNWTYQLVTGSSNDAPNSYNPFMAQPPTLTELDTAWKARVDQITRENVRTDPTGRVIQKPDARLTGADAQNAFKRNYLSMRANRIHLYVTRDAFQIRSWGFESTPPDDKAIFEAMVDLWVQQDIVNTILALNAQATSVANAPVKRLERIEVGAIAGESLVAGSLTPVLGDINSHHGSISAGDVFLLGTTGGNNSGAADYSRSMTGKTSNDKYDITRFGVVMYIESAKLNAFISELYKQNNGYTILKMNIDAADPLEIAGNGYLFGKVPVIRVAIQGEFALARDWTKPLMPTAIKVGLGIPEAKP